MLSEDTRGMLRYGCKLGPSFYPDFASRSPREHVDAVIGSLQRGELQDNARAQASLAEILANREEAEQVIAAALGLM